MLQLKYYYSDLIVTADYLTVSLSHIIPRCQALYTELKSAATFSSDVNNECFNILGDEGPTSQTCNYGPTYMNEKHNRLRKCITALNGMASVNWDYIYAEEPVLTKEAELLILSVTCENMTVSGRGLATIQVTEENAKNNYGFLMMVKVTAFNTSSYSQQRVMSQVGAVNRIQIE